jgi:hypothetical protein
MNIKELFKIHKYPSNKSIKIKNKDLQGWLDSGNKILLKKYIELLNPKVILELGAWKGLSTIYMLELFDGIVISVDNWIGGESILKNKKQKNDIDEVYNTFLRNLYDFRDRIIPIKMDGREGIKYLSTLGIKIDLIYLDMDHTYNNVINDLETLYEYFPDVIIIGDDFEYYDDVKKAVNEFIQKYNYKIEIIGNCYIIFPYVKQKILYSKENIINYSIIDYSPNNIMSVLICSVGNNYKNIEKYMISNNINYKICLINNTDNNYGSLINANILHNNIYDVIVLILDNNILIPEESSFYFGNYPYKPIIFDNPNTFTIGKKISLMSISRHDYYNIEGVPNIDNLELIKSVLYLRLSIYISISIPRYSFIKFDDNVKKVKIKDENLYLENSFKNGINSINYKFLDAKEINKNTYIYDFYTKYPQNNILFFQDFFESILNKVDNLDIKIENREQLTIPYKKLSNNKIRYLLINNSPYFNISDNTDKFDGTILDTLYILNIKNIKNKTIGIFMHIKNNTSDKTFEDNIKSILSSNVLDCYIGDNTKKKQKFDCENVYLFNINDEISINDKSYEIMYINYEMYNYKIKLITKNLKKYGSCIIYQETHDEKLFETITNILCYLFEKVMIYRPNYIMGHINYVYIIAKNKINDLLINNPDNNLFVDNTINNKIFENYYKYQYNLNNYSINIYNNFLNYSEKYPNNFNELVDIVNNRKKNILKIKEIKSKLTSYFIKNS